MANNLIDELEAIFGPMTHIVAPDPGNIVLCDMCNADYTESGEPGGFLFSSYAVCPQCTDKVEADAKEYGEEKHIKARCPSDMSFADWVRDVLRKR